MKKNILVTGSTGLLGSEIFHFSNKSFQFFGVARDANGLNGMFCGDIRDLDFLKRVVQKNNIECIIHTAAQPIVINALLNPAETFDINVKGTWNVLEVCRQMNIPMIFASTDKVYGRPRSLPSVEEDELLGTKSPYEASKVMCENMIDSFVEEFGLEVDIVRSVNIFGPNDTNYTRVIPGAIRAIKKHESFVIRTDGSLIREYIHVYDVASAFYVLLNRIFWRDNLPHVDVFNVSTGEAYSVLEIVNVVNEIAEQYFGFEVFDPIVLGQETNEIPEQRLNASKLRELGWKQTYSVPEGIKYTIEKLYRRGYFLD